MLLSIYSFADSGKARFSANVSAELAGTIDSVSVVVCIEPIADYENTRSYAMKPAGSSLFTTEVDGLDSISKIYFRIYSRGKASQPYFYAEDGDSVHISISRPDKDMRLGFSGRGAEKYIVMSSLSEDREKWLSDSIGFAGDPYRNLKMIKSFIADGKSQIERYKSEISQPAREILLTETTSFYHTQWLTNISHYYRKPRPMLSRKELLELYELFPAKTYSSNVSGLSVYYLIQILTQAKFDLYLLSENKGYSYTSVYEYLVSHTDGRVRERALLFFFAGMDGLNDLRVYDPSETVECLQDAEKYMTSANAKELLHSRSKLAMGSSFRDFELVDRQGNNISLQSMRGKAVVLEVWGRGCSGCAQFTRMFRQKIHPALSKQDVTLVSIGTEKDRKTWLDALDSGRYSIPADHELSTEGTGINHPLFQYYQLYAVPFVVVLDRKGKVYSTLSASMSADHMLQLIRAAVAVR